MLLVIRDDLSDEVVELTKGVGEGVCKVYLVVGPRESVLELEHVVFLAAHLPKDWLASCGFRIGVVIRVILAQLGQFVGDVGPSLHPSFVFQGRHWCSRR